jgi:hypothetical protein
VREGGGGGGGGDDSSCAVSVVGGGVSGGGAGLGIEVADVVNELEADGVGILILILGFNKEEGRETDAEAGSETRAVGVDVGIELDVSIAVLRCVGVEISSVGDVVVVGGVGGVGGGGRGSRDTGSSCCFGNVSFTLSGFVLSTLAFSVPSIISARFRFLGLFVVGILEGGVGVGEEGMEIVIGAATCSEEESTVALEAALGEVVAMEVGVGRETGGGGGLPLLLFFVIFDCSIERMVVTVVVAALLLLLLAVVAASGRVASLGRGSSLN